MKRPPAPNTCNRDVCVQLSHKRERCVSGMGRTTIGHGGCGGHCRDVVLLLEALQKHVHVQQAQEAAPVPDAQRLARLLRTQTLGHGALA